MASPTDPSSTNSNDSFPLGDYLSTSLSTNFITMNTAIVSSKGQRRIVLIDISFQEKLSALVS